VLALVTCGEGDQGPFVLSGPEEVVSRLGPQIANVLDGKGGGRKGRYQGKANKISARAAAEKIVREAVASQ
jgi:misacylated tRNA(Ala) deacylase